MNYKIDKQSINENINFNFLFDKVLGSINIKDNFAEFLIYDTFYLDKEPKYKLITKLGKNTIELINVYLYKITKGKIKGKLSSIEKIINNKISFQIYDGGYINSTFLLKGSIINNFKLNRNNILLEFCLEDYDSYLEIKEII